MRISKSFTLEQVKKILDGASQHKFTSEIKYYVNEKSQHSDESGFYTDKFIVGVHNRHTHFALSELQSYYELNK